MLSVEEALEQVLAHAQARRGVECPTSEALGLVLDEDSPGTPEELLGQNRR